MHIFSSRARIKNIVSEFFCKLVSQQSYEKKQTKKIHSQTMYTHTLSTFWLLEKGQLHFGHARVIFPSLGNLHYFNRLRRLRHILLKWLVTIFFFFFFLVWGGGFPPSVQEFFFYTTCIFKRPSLLLFRFKILQFVLFWWIFRFLSFQN